MQNEPKFKFACISARLIFPSGLIKTGVFMSELQVRRSQVFLRDGMWRLPLNPLSKLIKNFLVKKLAASRKPRL